MSDWYGVRDAACPLSKRRGGHGQRAPRDHVQARLKQLREVAEVVHEERLQVRGHLREIYVQ